MSGDSFKKHREEVTAALIEALENGTAPWQQSWSSSGPGSLPYNATTEKAYNGGNQLWLAVRQMKIASPDPRWATYNQCSWMHYGSDKKLTEAEHDLNKTLRADDPRRIPTWQVRKGSKGTWMLGGCRNGCSSYELARGLGVTQKTASLWARVLRIQRRPPSELGALVGANCAGASLRTTS
jgi:hypothetical protein